MSHLVLALGLVLAIEGLVLALAPRRIEDALRLLASLGLDQRRLIGLGALAFGVMLVWLARV
ncbi:MAG: DUF2065 domain-containing protein [Tabrizicola sp.]|uniref:DUF2065 domain-containing protein n=1 Tax=Tabrizicola sp. TaxID=2005166 RepID=UPI002ABC00E6|nr:DUF2065 domain-containing protein [Tabrizicola sp.]MDZ4089390.1 DUF2065 domain-containing protein [Tabrizicola sp.]